MNKIKKFLDNTIYYLLLYGLFILAVVYLIGRVRSWIVFDNYTKTTYGIISNKLKVKYKGRFAGSDVRGYHGAIDRWWVSAYEVKAPFMDKTFEVWVDKRDYTFFGTDFYEVLSNDSKFEHLYSEWVKKQVGIDDDNVELKFAGNFDPPYIEFDKITTLSEDYREIFENTHNLYVWLCRVKNISELNNANKKDIAENIRKEYLYKMLKITGISKDISKNYFGHIELSNANFIKDKNLNYSFRFNARLENSKLEELNY